MRKQKRGHHVPFFVFIRCVKSKHSRKAVIQGIGMMAAEKAGVLCIGEKSGEKTRR